MLKLIVDASIVLKWIPGRNEEKVDEAREIYKMMIDDRLKIIAPTFLLIEVLNILANKRKTDPKVIKEIIEDFTNGKINFVELRIEKIKAIEDLVFKFQTTSYDALYLHLAKENNCKLVTIDRELLKLHDLTIDIDQLLKSLKSN